MLHRVAHQVVLVERQQGVDLDGGDIHERVRRLVPGDTAAEDLGAVVGAGHVELDLEVIRDGAAGDAGGVLLLEVVLAAGLAGGGGLDPAVHQVLHRDQAGLGAAVAGDEAELGVALHPVLAEEELGSLGVIVHLGKGLRVPADPVLSRLETERILVVEAREGQAVHHCLVAEELQEVPRAPEEGDCAGVHLQVERALVAAVRQLERRRAHLDDGVVVVRHRGVPEPDRELAPGLEEVVLRERGCGHHFEAARHGGPVVVGHALPLQEGDDDHQQSGIEVRVRPELRLLEHVDHGPLVPRQSCEFAARSPLWRRGTLLDCRKRRKPSVSADASWLRRRGAIR